MITFTLSRNLISQADQIFVHTHYCFFPKLSNHNFIVSNPLHLFWPFKPFVNFLFAYCISKLVILPFYFKKSFLSLLSIQELIYSTKNEKSLVLPPNLKKVNPQNLQGLKPQTQQFPHLLLL